MIQMVLEYIKENYYFICYVVVLLLALKKYPLYFNTSLKYLPIVFTYMLLTEILGFFIYNFEEIQIIAEKEYSYANNLIYNIFDIVYFSYFYFIFWRTFQQKQHKKVVVFGLILFLAVSLINPFFEDFLVFPQTVAYAVGSLVFLTCIILYVKEVTKNLQKENELLVWLCIGHFIFYCSFPIILFIGIYHYEIYEDLNLRQIHHLIVAAMYTCFIVGYIRLKQPISKR